MAGRNGARQELTSIDVASREKKNDLEGRETWKSEKPSFGDPLTRLCLSISVFRPFSARFPRVLSYDLACYCDRSLDKSILSLEKKQEIAYGRTEKDKMMRSSPLISAKEPKMRGSLFACLGCSFPGDVHSGVKIHHTL